MFAEVWMSLGIIISLVSLAHSSCCCFFVCFLNLPFLGVQNLSPYWVWVMKTSRSFEVLLVIIYHNKTGEGALRLLSYYHQTLFFIWFSIFPSSLPDFRCIGQKTFFIPRGSVACYLSYYTSNQLWYGGNCGWGGVQTGRPLNNCCHSFNLERTEKLPMGSIKNVVSEPIEGHEDYHMMVSSLSLSGHLLLLHLAGE